MFNRPTNLFAESAGGGSSSAGAWQVDQNPGLRLICLLLAMALPLLAVTGRLVYLQGYLGEDFVTEVDRTVESFEPIPSRDGRILASDGKVLAYDVERFNVRMHYRRLEEPANESWLRQQVLSRLKREERRERERVEAEKATVLAERAEMWNRLAQVTGSPPERLTELRHAVQQRVERMIATVEANRHERRNSGDAGNVEAVSADGPFWETAWNTVVAALTTSPDRGLDDPLVIQEELDYHPVVEGVSLQVAAEIEAHPELFPGMQIEVVTQRVYPHGTLAPHIIGYRGDISDEELAERKQRFPDGDPLDYRPGDRIGKAGVERSYDLHLHGVRGLRKVIRNRRGEIVRTETVREPRTGRDIMLTLDIPLQQQIEKLLDATLGDTLPTIVPASTEEQAELSGLVPRGGCILALDIHTGAVIAAASAPRFDLSLFTGSHPDQWQQTMADPRRPFFPRATRMTLAPGSTFKALTAVALLESGQVAPADTIFCRGYLDTPERHRCYIYRHFGVGHGDMNLSDALCQSCNVYFFGAAREVGAEPIVHWAQQFGFGQPTGIDLPGELGGNLPCPPHLRLAAGEGDGKSEVGSRKSDMQVPQSKIRNPQSLPWYSGDTLGLAIGQSRLTVTPLQIARMMAAVANDGYLVMPHVVEVAAVGAGNLDAIEIGDRLAGPLSGQFEPRRIPGLSPTTLSQVREGLKKVVANPRGTGYKRVRLKEIEIAGKTGTAEVGGGKPDHAWFAGYVPADEPRIAFVVVLENAGAGGSTAGPVAQQLVRLMLADGLLRPARVTLRE